jgi:hypothetical protein
VVRDFPVDVLKAMGTDSTQPTKGPWTVTSHPYIYRCLKNIYFFGLFFVYTTQISKLALLRAYRRSNHVVVIASQYISDYNLVLESL